MKHLLTTLLLAVVAVSAGCMSVQSDQALGNPTFVPTDPGLVQILRSPPTRPHLRLGKITVEPNEGAKVQAIEQKFQQAASKWGANAVVIVADRTELMGMEATGGWYNDDVTPITGRVIVGVAIRYTDELGQAAVDPLDMPGLEIEQVAAASKSRQPLPGNKS